MWRLIVLPALAAAPAVLLAAQPGLRLDLDFADAAARRELPVTSGIPFARGVLRDAAAVRLRAGADALPVQTEVLAWWPDGSVKWLLLDFQAPAGLRNVDLVIDPQSPAPRPPAAVTAAAADDAVTVDTGVIQFTIRKNGGGFIDALRYRGAALFDSPALRANFMDAIHTARPADYHPMNRMIAGGQLDPSRLVITGLSVEQKGPMRAVAVIDGRYAFRHVGSTITGTDVRGDCPFRIRVHAYAGQSFLKIEHFFYYEGDGDHDFVRAYGLRVPVPAGSNAVRLIGDAGTVSLPGPLAGIYQQHADSWEAWTSTGAAPAPAARGTRFNGVLDVAGPAAGVALGIRDMWQNAAKALHADLRAGWGAILLWPPEAPPLDFRRHAREWSVGETGEPDDKDSDKPAPMKQPNYRLASKGVGKTHYAFIYIHGPDETAENILAAYRAFNRPPVAWASPRYYASTLALGHYREYVPGEHEDIEKALDAPVRFWRHSQEHFRWYGIWLYGNVCQNINQFLLTGRWEQDFGRWGWANGDSVGRLGYALMLQAVRKCRREDLEFAERYVYNIHDVCSTHSPAYPEHYRNFMYFKGASHRHGAWPWACPYTGIRGAHPVGAKIHFYLTGEGHTQDILDELTQLVLRRPDGGMGDGPLGPNAQIFLYQWERTGDEKWKARLKAEIESSGLKTARGGWEVMMNAAFGIFNALEEYMDLSGDDSLKDLCARFADEAMPEKMKRHWTWGGYFRVYAAAYRITRNPKYRLAIEEMLPVLLERASASAAAKLPEKDWPGRPGGPTVFVDGNIIRDIPFALHALHLDAAKEAK